MSEKRSKVITDIHEIIAQRWSPRAFAADKAVAREKLLSILEAARWAPSCFGDEPWRFVVCDRFEDESQWQLMLKTLAPKNQEWAQHAPIFILICADSVFRHNGIANRWAQYDTGAAAISLCLQANALGLVSHQMGGFDPNAVKACSKVPEQFTPMSVIAIGYQGEALTLDEGFRAIEMEERHRQPLTEIAFSGQWNQGFYDD
ncbi:MAG: nitroreductase family protein [Mariprofundaceae bacterium]